MEIKDIVSIENSNVDESIIDLAILRAEYMVKNYCNIDSIPQELIYIVADIVTDIIKEKYSIKESDNIKSIQQGDTTISFNSKEEVSISIEDIVRGYSRDLNKYRRLKR